MSFHPVGAGVEVVAAVLGMVMVIDFVDLTHMDADEDADVVDMVEEGTVMAALNPGLILGGLLESLGK